MGMVCVFGWLTFAQPAWATERQLRVHSPPSEWKGRGFSSLLTLLRERGWAVVHKGQVTSDVIQLRIVSSYTILLQKGTYKRTFLIPERYKSLRTRVRTIATFVDLFSEMEPLQRQGRRKKPARTSQQTNPIPPSRVRPRPVLPRSQVRSVPSPRRAKPKVRRTFVPPRSRGRLFVRTLPRRTRSRRRESPPKVTARTLPRRAAPPVRKRETLPRTRPPVRERLGKRPTPAAPRKRSDVVVARRSPSPPPVKKRVTKPQPRKVASAKLQPGKRVAQLDPSAGVVVERPPPPKKQPRDWQVALEGGAMLGFQGEAQLPVGGWLALSGEFQRWALRLLWDVSVPVGLSPEQGSLLRMRPGLTVGVRILGERFQWHAELGVLLEGLSSSSQQQTAWRWRVGGVAATRLHIRLLPQLWFVSRLAISVFPQTYEFRWQTKTLYQAEPWFLELGVGLRVSFL